MLRRRINMIRKTARLGGFAAAEAALAAATIVRRSVTEVFCGLRLVLQLVELNGRQALRCHRMRSVATTPPDEGGAMQQAAWLLPDLKKVQRLPRCRRGNAASRAAAAIPSPHPEWAKMRRFRTAFVLAVAALSPRCFFRLSSDFLGRRDLPDGAVGLS